MSFYEEFKHLCGDMPDELTSKGLVGWQAEAYNDRAGELRYYDCPICKNKGDIAYPRGDVLAYKPCSCRKIRYTYYLIDQQGLTDAIREKTFESFTIKHDWQAKLKVLARKYAETGDKYWFTVLGQTGAGKTHICTAIIGRLLQEKQEVRYLPYRSVIPKIKRLVMEEQSYTLEMKKWKDCEVLYIDDLFWGKITDSDLNIVFEIIDSRYRKKKRTIISSERTISELLSISAAIAGRIFEMCGEYKTEIGKDPRKNYRLKDIVA